MRLKLITLSTDASWEPFDLQPATRWPGKIHRTDDLIMVCMGRRECCLTS